MNDDVYINDLKQSYEIINNTNTEIDNKSLSMIVIIGAMITIQLSFLLPTFKNNPTGTSICIWASVVYIVPILLFTISLISRRFKYYPDMESIIDNYECDISESEYITSTIGMYGSTNKYNLEVINFKGIISRIGFIAFIIAIGLTLISVII